MTAVQFTGQQPLTYPGYLDTATGRTLTCVPGGTYDVIPASGTLAEIPTDGRFIRVITPRTSVFLPVQAGETSAAPAAPDTPEGGKE
jgi:hypothetical protein